ncbi:CRISPR-associated RAMP protein, Csm3 family [Desulfurispirillum indicum S5]|uniref:CRISPR system Cms endoribonuclease Csm3 n=1 Tax=Desulfurispirillum indicum (strain ATCC BAA-1389 / DSM 22839 / S5) TaxID=653733 RepID=E6W3H6_DESIS|nr:type III-A CRISPR-associated RAMP protein Csm3 [Desulfurispirillum indicum]ADU65769.1 CRISPR-associated RAMP protein, Csm3 family [Desulfurispirillum indicum S5]
MQIKEIRKIECSLKVITGLHIGGGNDEIKIGGVDNVVIRDPLTSIPYIPGSSLKGKIRSLAEWTTGCVDTGEGNAFYIKGKASDAPSNALQIVKIFGNGKPDGLEDDNHTVLQTRVAISDAFMTPESQKLLLEKLGSYTETKYEVSINRLQGKVGGGGPRQIERVPAGAEFTFEAIYKVFHKSDDAAFNSAEETAFQSFLEYIELLNHDGLGGGSSRGNGRVEVQWADSQARYSVAWPKTDQKDG